MINVDGKDIGLLDADWDVLVILDACKLDIFKQIYGDIIHRKGNLKKAKTFCSGTFDWMQNNFKDKDCSDIIYIDCIVMFDEFMPTNSFFKVVKIWKYVWDYEYGTIKPEDMTDYALEYRKLYPDKRIIIHYHQPHAPYLQEKFKGIYKIDTPATIQNGVKENGFGHFYQGCTRRFFGYEQAWKWFIKLGIKPLDYYGVIYQLYGREGLVEGYTENLKLVLKEMNRLSGRIVVTSDHSHNLDGDARTLKEQYVPWLEMV